LSTYLHCPWDIDRSSIWAKTQLPFENSQNQCSLQNRIGIFDDCIIQKNNDTLFFRGDARNFIKIKINSNNNV